MIITFDLLNEIQRSLVHWKALAKVLLSTPPTFNSVTQPERKITHIVKPSHSTQKIQADGNKTP
jgi:hypothetical protein